MEKNHEEQEVSLLLSKAEAIVLLEWLINFNNKEHAELFDDQSEEVVLWTLESILERNLSEILDPNYLEILEQARKAVKDEE